MPVLPVVDAVADAEFAVDFLLFHKEMEFHIELHEEVVIPAVDEPGDGPEFAEGFLGSVLQEIQGGVLDDRLPDVI